jgi:hypothetical protein
MTDDAEMRLRLQQVVAYRQLCRTIRSRANHTLVNAAIWLGLTYFLYNLERGLTPIVLAYLVLGVGELLVGLWKKLTPTLEAVLADGLILLGFGVVVLGRQVLVWQGIIKNMPVSPISVFLGIWWLSDAFKTFRNYGDLRRSFPERPSGDQLRWFDDLIREIRSSDPETDEVALDLPTRPRFKAKMFGSTAFLVAVRGDHVWVAGPEDFDIARERKDHGTGRRRARLTIHGQSYPEFEISDSTWANYQKWIAANAPRTLPE